MAKLLFRTLLFFFLIFFLSGTLHAQSQNAKLKAIYIQNFTKYIEWPSKKGDFVIGVLGNTPTLSFLKNIASRSKTKTNQDIVIKTYSSVEQIGKCQLLYVTKGKSSLLKSVTSKLKNNHTLIITEKPGLAKKGAAINFVINDNKMKFELNKSNAEKYGLNVGSSLAKLAIVVN